MASQQPSSDGQGPTRIDHIINEQHRPIRNFAVELRVDRDRYQIATSTPRPKRPLLPRRSLKNARYLGLNPRDRSDRFDLIDEAPLGQGVFGVDEVDVHVLEVTSRLVELRLR